MDDGCLVCCECVFVHVRVCGVSVSGEGGGGWFVVSVVNFFVGYQYEKWDPKWSLSSSFLFFQSSSVHPDGLHQRLIKDFLGFEAPHTWCPAALQPGFWKAHRLGSIIPGQSDRVFSHNAC